MLIFLREELGYLKASYVSASLVSGHHSTVVCKKVRPYSGGQKQGGNSHGVFRSPKPCRFKIWMAEAI